MNMRLTTSMRGALLLLVPLMFIFELGCGKADFRKTLRSSGLQAPEGGPVVLAAYQPWFGRSGHIDVGYSSQDRTVLQHQIEKAKGLGITAFVVNWYGARHHFEDQSYALMQQLSEQLDFHVALMYDEDESSPEDSTGTVINDLQYAYGRYIAPSSEVSNRSYLRYQGR